MSTLDEYVARQLADPERCKRFRVAMVQLELGQLLYDAGWQKGLSVAEVAAQIGVRPEYLERLEQGDGNPRIGQIAAWLAALGYQVRITIEPLERGKE